MYFETQIQSPIFLKKFQFWGGWGSFPQNEAPLNEVQNACHSKKREIVVVWEKLGVTKTQRQLGIWLLLFPYRENTGNFAVAQ